MRYALLATPRFGALVLEELVAQGIPPLAVVCNPDRPAGRTKALTAPPAKIAALSLGIPVLQPERLEDAHEDLRHLDADLFLVAAFGRILRPELLAIPRHGTIGVHPSLLPRHRGPSPIQQAILDGDPETGVSLFVVDELVDHGPVVASARLGIEPGETYLSLEQRLARLGGSLAAATLPGWVSGEVAARDQDHGIATFTSKFGSDDAFVAAENLVAAASDPLKARQVARVVAALNPEPGAWTALNGKRVKLLEARATTSGLVVSAYQVAGKRVVRERLPLGA